jgi:nucleoside-diphosphate-sugar epimerase
MNVALTGSSGFVGSHVLSDLVTHGHEVTALVRSKKDADAVAAQGAEAALVDLHDRVAVVNVLVKLDGSIHTASPGDTTSADLDSAMADAVIEAYSGSGKPHIQISGLWVYGDNTTITEESPRRAPPMVAWKEPIERRLLSEPGLRAVVPVSGSAYGDGGGGIPGLLLGSPRDEAGNLIMIGQGGQHWVSVHVADLADFFRRALEQDSAHGYYAIGNGLAPTVAELTEAAAVAVGASGAVTGSEAEARSRLGDYFAEVLLLDQVSLATRAHVELGWEPSHLGFIEELRTGSYRK